MQPICVPQKNLKKNFSEPQEFVILLLPYLLTPQKWLIERRLEKAAELLSEDMSVTDTYIQENSYLSLR